MVKGRVLLMTKVLIVAALDIIQERLFHLVEKENEYKVICCTPYGNEVIRICSEKKPNLIIMYIGVQEIIDFSIMKEIKSISKEIKIMILALGGDKKNLLLALKHGADGYIMNDNGINEIFTIMADSYNKVKNIHKENYINRIRNIYDKGIFSQTHFTLREKEVLNLVSEGFTNHEIGIALGISSGRARNIVTDLIAKCMVKNRTQLAVLAVKINMLSIHLSDDEIYE